MTPDRPAVVGSARDRRIIIAGGVMVAAVVAVALGGPLRTAIPKLSRVPAPTWWLLAVAATAIATSYLAAAIGLRAASGSRLPFGRTVLAQLAAALANRVVPGGIGGAAVNLRYLRKSGLTPVTAGVAVTAVAVANGAASLLVLLAVGPPAALRSRQLGPHAGWLLTVAGVAVLALTTSVTVARRRLPDRLLWQARQWRDQARTVAVVLGRDPRRLALVFAGSLGVRVAHVGALLAALSAFGAHLPVVLVITVYLGSTAAASLIPTPGGLGTLETILVAALVAIGGSATAMLAAVLVFRLVSWWLPIAPGFAATWALRRRLAL